MAHGQRTARYAVLAVLVLSAACTDRGSIVSPEEPATGKPPPVDPGDPLFSRGGTWDARAADMDGDGMSDLLVTTHEGWRQPGGVWLQRTDGWFGSAFHFPKSNDRHGCATADVNLDGLIDFYCQTGTMKGEGERANELWLQQTDGTFVDGAGAWGVKDSYGRGRRPIFFDHDGDGGPGLYTTVWGKRVDDEVNRNRLWINEGGTGSTRSSWGPTTPPWGSRRIRRRAVATSRSSSTAERWCSPAGMTGPARSCGEVPRRADGEKGGVFRFAPIRSCASSLPPAGLQQLLPGHSCHADRPQPRHEGCRCVLSWPPMATPRCDHGRP
ncbi:MAG TPA: VCBS repeat-containing protein [Actinomycetota bacterium]|jgi:hypothetical protein|nr:VCBS repeat-containing protein [Actinomycetota bacterium]